MLHLFFTPPPLSTLTLELGNMPIVTATFKNGQNHTCLTKKAERLSENIRKINRGITERKFYACNISPQLVENHVAQTPLPYRAVYYIGD